MKTQQTGLHFLLAVIFLALEIRPSAAGEIGLRVEQRDGAVQLHWPAQRVRDDGTSFYPIFELQQTSDFAHWEPIGQRQRGSETTLGLGYTVTPGTGGPVAFYRLQAVEPPAVARLSRDGADVLGYADAFLLELGRVGSITPDDVAILYPADADYLSRISFDPATATFWDGFNADPDAWNQDKEYGQRGWRFMDYRLNDPELGLFKTNGFVVSERLGNRSFASSFYDLWHSDLPVFISTDALLQAWHRTYDAILEETEETYLSGAVQTMLDGMAGQVSSASARIGDGALKESLKDADYFLTVARALLADTNSPAVTSTLGQDERVAATLADINAELMKPVDDFMGYCRTVDFSQFKVRGHYIDTDRLGRYFKCMTWLGRIDFPVAGGDFARCGGGTRTATTRELGQAIVLWNLLNASGQFQNWAGIDQLLQAFVGPTDSMTFGQLSGLLAGAGILTLGDANDFAALERIQAAIAAGKLGVQNIRSDWFNQPFAGGAYALPQSFTVIGQKFTPDAWAFSQTIFDKIAVVRDGATNYPPRRLPGALDTAFAALGNNQIVPELLAQMNGTFPNPGRRHAQTFRDGFAYQQNLAAVRNVIDQQSTASWDANVYMNWLDCLRALSKPTTEGRFPEAMRTRAWAMKTVNTQLASWTQLRHNNVLSVKEPYGCGDCGCVYPTGYVEPRLEFWQKLKYIAARTADRIGSFTFEGSYQVVTNLPLVLNPETGEIVDPGGPQTNVFSFSAIRTLQKGHLRHFASVIGQLETLVAKELTQTPFTADELKFVDGLVEERLGNGLYSPIKYNGWYPQLFYRTIYWNDWEFHQTHGAGGNDALVIDVFTDPPSADAGDPGSVLHEAVGYVNLMVIAVNNGTDRFVCAGPVLSHYEFEVTGAPRRITDPEWKRIIDPSFPGLPEGVTRERLEGISTPPWTKPYLVPNPASVP